MATLAIIGAGIAGLGCAHFLHRHYQLTIFERNAYAGGHTNTIVIDEEGTPVPIDTGFMVYNEVTYPNLTRLFRELEVVTKPTSMSFSVRHAPSGIEYNGTSFAGLFAQRRNLLSMRFWRLLRQIDRFNREAIVALHASEHDASTVSKYVADRGYGDDFLHLFLIPMSSAVWSTPPDRMLDFPAMTLLHFFHNHGFLGLHTQHPWRTVTGGAQSYVRKITAPFRDRIALGAPAVRVTRRQGRAQVTTADGVTVEFDKVILASHANETLSLLGDPTPLEARLLGEFQYQPNLATLHTDASVMPKTRRAWASWNYRIHRDEGRDVPSTHYWMNSLQGVSEKRNYFVSVNGADMIDPKHVLRRIDYEHPLFSLGAITAQEKLPSLNELAPEQSTYFCGSYFKYGFHEDALTSALACARAVTGEPLWS